MQCRSSRSTRTIRLPSTPNSSGGCERPSSRTGCGPATSCRRSGSSRVDLRVNANTVARVYAELERSGVIETRRGVGSFITAAGRTEARPAEEKARRLRAFVTKVLADAAAAGFHAR
mgnify:CR=1 FL=1